MAVRMLQIVRNTSELRYHPTDKRVRVRHRGSLVADTTDAVLVWEPRRIGPSYAVPRADVRAELRPAPYRDEERSQPPVLHPGIPFAVHSTDGEPLTVVTDGQELVDAAFRPSDKDLADYVMLDFRAFDEWLEEDELIVSHARDPFHRIDVRRSSRHVRIELDGEPLAESTRPRLLFETGLPTRFYLPRDDVRTELLRPSPTHSACAYKGVASYWSLDLGNRHEPDLVWTYPQPLADATEIADLLAFFNERVDVVVDGDRKPRPRTFWSDPSSITGA